jgi:hypothetical protein
MTKTIGDRISVVDHEKSTTIVVLPKRVRWKEILLITWLICFTVAGLYVIYLLFFGGIDELKTGVNFDESVRDQQLIYLTIFVAFWGYFEFITAKATLWYLFGKELLMIDTEALTVKKSIFKYGKAQRYFFENIKKITYEKPDSTSLNSFLDNAYWSTGTEVFRIEYFTKTKSFGRRIDEKEANLLLRLINDRVKKWKKKS